MCIHKSHEDNNVTSKLVCKNWLLTILNYILLCHIPTVYRPLRQHICQIQLYIQLPRFHLVLEILDFHGFHPLESVYLHILFNNAWLSLCYVYGYMHAYVLLIKAMCQIGQKFSGKFVRVEEYFQDISTKYFFILGDKCF